MTGLVPPSRRGQTSSSFWTDDQGYADVSVHGCKDYQTPHLDSLAKNGVRCTSGYVTQPQCSPSRAGMLTGRHQSRFGHEENPPGDADPKLGLPPTEKTLADYLKAAGYVTGPRRQVAPGHHASKAPLHARVRGVGMRIEAAFETTEAETAFAAERAARFARRRGKYGALCRNGEPEQMPGYVADALADEVVGVHRPAPRRAVLPVLGPPASRTCRRSPTRST